MAHAHQPGKPTEPAQHTAAQWAEDEPQPGTAVPAHPSTQAAAVVAAAASTPSQPALAHQPGAPQQAVAHPPGPPIVHPLPLQQTQDDTMLPPPEGTTQHLHPAHTQRLLHQALLAQLPHRAGPKARLPLELSMRPHPVPEAAA